MCANISGCCLTEERCVSHLWPTRSQAKAFLCQTTMTGVKTPAWCVRPCHGWRRSSSASLSVILMCFKEPALHVCVISDSTFMHRVCMSHLRGAPCIFITLAPFTERLHAIATTTSLPYISRGFYNEPNNSRTVLPPVWRSIRLALKAGISKHNSGTSNHLPSLLYPDPRRSSQTSLSLIFGWCFLFFELAANCFLSFVGSCRSTFILHNLAPAVPTLQVGQWPMLAQGFGWIGFGYASSS